MIRSLLVATVLLGSFVASGAPSKEAIFAKVKTVYISHMQKKIMTMSETTTCMAQAKDMDGLKVCAKDGKTKLAALDKKAHDAHMKAQKKKK